MSFSPKPCAHCGGLNFHVLPGMLLEVWQSTTALGMPAIQRLPGGARWTVTLVVCAQCGRTETFTANAAELAQQVRGAHMVNGAPR